MMKQFYAAVALLAIIISLASANEPSEIKMSDWFKRIQRSANVTNIQREPSGRTDFVSASSYPTSNFLMYGTNCMYVGSSPSKEIAGVSDVLKCGSQHCAGNRKCSHFTLTPTIENGVKSGICTLLLSTSTVKPAKYIENAKSLCGFIPVRACIDYMDSLPSLLSCITYPDDTDDYG